MNIKLKHLEFIVNQNVYLINLKHLFEGLNVNQNMHMSTFSGNVAFGVPKQKIVSAQKKMINTNASTCVSYATGGYASMLKVNLGQNYTIYHMTVYYRNKGESVLRLVDLGTLEMTKTTVITISSHTNTTNTTATFIAR